MSERSERIVAALDSEWRSTKEIAARAGVDGLGDTLGAVHHSLGMALKYGQAEKKIVIAEGRGRIAMWRRRT